MRLVFIEWYYRLFFPNSKPTFQTTRRTLRQIVDGQSLRIRITILKSASAQRLKVELHILRTAVAVIYKVQ